MKIKAAASQAGLTPRAVRLYIDSGLLAPEVYRHNDRNFVEFSDEDVKRLKLIASLRDAMLSIAQIKRMLDSPEATGEVFTEYRRELASEFGELSELIARVDVIDPERLDSPESLVGALVGADTPEVSDGDDTVSLDRPGVCEDYIPDDERKKAYLEWQKKQKRRDKYAFLTDWIYRFEPRHALLLLIIPALLIAYGLIVGIHRTIPIDIDASGYEIMPTDYGYAEELHIRVKGEIREMLFGDDHFIGSVTIDGYELKQIGDRVCQADSKLKILLRSEGYPMTRLMTLENGITAKLTKRGSNDLVTLAFSEDRRTVVLKGGWADDPKTFAVFPCDSKEMAFAFAARVLDERPFGDSYVDEYRSALGW